MEEMDSHEYCHRHAHLIKMRYSLLYNAITEIRFQYVTITRRLENEKQRTVGVQKDFHRIFMMLIATQPNIRDGIYFHVERCEIIVIRYEYQTEFGDDHFAIDFGVHRQMFAWECVQYLIAERTARSHIQC